jgi:hypothetical protein
MKYDQKTNTVTLSSGRTFTTYGDDFTPNGLDGICYGSDGGVDTIFWANEERLEIADHMIRRWAEWLTAANGFEPEPQVGVLLSPDSTRSYLVRDTVRQTEATALSPLTFDCPECSAPAGEVCGESDTRGTLGPCASHAARVRVLLETPSA